MKFNLFGGVLEIPFLLTISHIFGCNWWDYTTNKKGDKINKRTCRLCGGIELRDSGEWRSIK